MRAKPGFPSVEDGESKQTVCGLTQHPQVSQNIFSLSNIFQFNPNISSTMETQGTTTTSPSFISASH